MVLGNCEVLVTICQSEARDNPLGVGTIPSDPYVHISGGTGLSVNRNSEAPNEEIFNVVCVE
jgi:hypothetical protein